MAIIYPLSLPAVSGIRRIKLTPRTVVGIASSPFTGQQQVQQWPGEWWEASCSLPPMERDNAEQWAAFGAALRGQAGTFLLGDPAGATPRGAATGTPVCDGTNAAGSKILATRGWTPSTVVLKAGDYIQLGVGSSATRIKTSGGSNVLKYEVVAVSTSVNGQVYSVTVSVQNVGSKTVTVSDNFGGTQTVAPGEQKRVALSCTGNGSWSVKIQFISPSASDSLDFIAWEPVVQRVNVPENLLATNLRKFEGWTAFGGATVTVQNQNQRLYKVLSDVTTDSTGKALIDIFPALREAPLDGDKITTSNCAGLFRMTEPVSWDIDEAKHYGISFNAVEAF